MRTERQRILRRAQKHRRRVKLAGSFGSFTAEEWAAIVARQRGRCADCGERKPLTVDHIVPVARGGCNFAFNIQGLCGPCNGRKNDRITDQQWSLFDGHRESKKPEKRVGPRIRKRASKAKPRDQWKNPDSGSKWAANCENHTQHGCKACNLARWRAKHPPKPPRIKAVKVPKVRAPRTPKEPLVSVGIPESLYNLIREMAYQRNVTMVSLVAEALTSHYGVTA